MSNYSYFSTVHLPVLEQLKKYQTEDWAHLLKSIFQNENILGIDFSDINPFDRLKDLYKIVLKYNLNETNFQETIVNLLVEYFGKEVKAQETYTLIQLIGFVKPTSYFNKLFLLVCEYSNNDDLKGVYDNHSLRLHLINQIMAFDINNRLYKYLISLQSQKQIPEYYQITMKYILNNKNSLNEFNSFFKGISIYLQDEANIKYILHALREYINKQRSFEILFDWLFENFKSFQNRRENIKTFKNVLNYLFDIEEWTWDSIEDLEPLPFFYEYYVIIGALLGDSKSIAPYINKFLRSSNLKNLKKQKLCEFFGELIGEIPRIKKIRLEEKTECLILKIDILEINLMQHGEFIENGIIRRRFNHNRKSDFYLSNAIIQQSLNPKGYA